MVQLLEVSKNKTRIHQKKEEKNIYSTTKTIITKSETENLFPSHRPMNDDRSASMSITTSASANASAWGNRRKEITSKNKKQKEEKNADLTSQQNRTHHDWRPCGVTVILIRCFCWESSFVRSSLLILFLLLIFFFSTVSNWFRLC